MKSHVLKTTVFCILTIGIFGSISSASPDIQTVEPWPEDIGHNDDIYIDSEIVDSETSVEDAWFTVSLNGEQVGHGTLRDSNNDGYYVSPVSVEAEGDENYEVVVNACNSDDQCSSQTTTVKTNCKIDILDRCFY